MIVIDIQGFKTSDKTFTPKELATYDGSHISHYIFKAPFKFNCLDAKLQNEAIWLMKNHHCIDWNEGVIPAFLFKQILSRLVKDADMVYVKGREKAEFIRKHITMKVIELDEQPALTPLEPSCLFHKTSKCMCALTNVYHLYNNYSMQ